MQKQIKNHGFTLIELVIVIVLLGLLGMVAVVKWPSGMGQDAAAMEFKRAIRFAQHMAMTREYTTASAAWGLATSGNQYTVKRRDDSETASDPGGETYPRSLPDNITISAGSVYFNGYGEPIAPAAGQTFTIGGITTLTVCPQTGYVKEGTACP